MLKKIVLSFISVLLISPSLFAGSKPVSSVWFQFKDGLIQPGIIAAHNNRQIIPVIEEKGRVCVVAGLTYCVVQDSDQISPISFRYGEPRVEVYNSRMQNEGSNLGKKLNPSDSDSFQLTGCNYDVNQHSRYPYEKIQDLKGCKIEMRGFLDQVYTFWGVFLMEGYSSLTFGETMHLKVQLGDDSYNQEVQAFISYEIDPIDERR